MASFFDPQPPDRQKGLVPTNRELVNEPHGIDFLALLTTAEDISRRYQTATLSRSLTRGYRAWNNQHAENSKYLGAAFRGRSRLFVPKTRAAVRKNLAGAAAALFSTDDVVNISASYEDDPIQRATAAVLKADVDYRPCRTGADHYAHEWWVLVGRDVGCDEERYPPDWTRHGNAAGPMRNAEMVRDGADEAVAFFEPGEGNKGTLDCVGKAQAAGIPTFTWGEPR